MKLNKGDEVWMATTNRVGSGYSENAKVTLDHGVVSGGGEYMVIVSWAIGTRARALTRHGEQRIPRYEAEQKFSPTRREALEQLLQSLAHGLDTARRQQEIIARLSVEAKQLLAETDSVGGRR